jgi:hypothetical protein
MALFLLIIMNLLTIHVYALAPIDVLGIINDIDELVPSLLHGDIHEAEVTLCGNALHDLVVKILHGEESASLALADLTVSCMETLGPLVVAIAEIDILVDALPMFACYKIADSILFGALDMGAEAFCNPILSAFGPTTTSPIATASSTPSSTPNRCISIDCFGDCNNGVSPFQGATVSCPCPGGLACDCTSSSGASSLPICHDALGNVVAISSGSGCGICNCPAVVGPPLTFDPTGISGSCSCSCNLCSTYNLC